MTQIKSNIEQIPNQQTLIDQNDSNNIYLGITKIGGATASSIWQIRKIASSGGITSIRYANGTPAFNNIWDNRSSYSYS